MYIYTHQSVAVLIMNLYVFFRGGWQIYKTIYVRISSVNEFLMTIICQAYYGNNETQII